MQNNTRFSQSEEKMTKNRTRSNQYGVEQFHKHITCGAIHPDDRCSIRIGNRRMM